MTLDEVKSIVSSIVEQFVDDDTELLDSGVVDSMALLEIGMTLRLPFDRFEREKWGTCRGLWREVQECSSLGLLTDGESQTQDD